MLEKQLLFLKVHFERSMSVFREQAVDLGVTLVSDTTDANIILSNGTKSTYTGEGTVLTPSTMGRIWSQLRAKKPTR